MNTYYNIKTKTRWQNDRNEINPDTDIYQDKLGHYWIRCGNGFRSNTQVAQDIIDAIEWKDKTLTFADLKPGEKFKILRCDDVYTKIVKDSRIGYNCINHYYQLKCVLDDAEVERV